MQKAKTPKSIIMKSIGQWARMLPVPIFPLLIETLNYSFWF